MKRAIALVLALTMLFMFAGCKAKDPHEGEARFTGVVMNDIGESIIVRTYDLYEDKTEPVFVEVSKKTRDKNEVEEYWQGSAVTVYYDGTVKEIYPPLVENVYAIEPLELEQ